MKNLLEVGYVARAHGLRGELGVRLFDPLSDALCEGRRVHLLPREGPERSVAIAALRESAKELLVTLTGVGDRTAAEALVGAQVRVDRDDLAAPAPGEFFQGDLVGLFAVDEAGAPLGQIVEIWNSGPVPNLVVRGPAGEQMVPFADPFVVRVDLQAGRVVVRPLEYVE